MLRPRIVPVLSLALSSITILLGAGLIVAEHRDGVHDLKPQ